MRMGPEELARVGIKRIDRLRVPEDKLPLARELVYHRRRVAWLLGAERAPELLASVLVERDRHAPLTARETDQLPAIHQRMAGESPHRSLDAEILFEIARPKHRAFRGVETEEV